MTSLPHLSAMPRQAGSTDTPQLRGIEDPEYVLELLMFLALTSR